MSIHTPSTDEATLQAALDDLMAGKPVDREASRKALEDLKRGCEEIRKRVGTVDIVNDLLRESRSCE